MPLIVIGLNHRSSPVALRERFAFSEAELPLALDRLCHSGIAEEAVILSTCNRVEIYAAVSDCGGDACQALQEFLAQLRNVTEPINGEIYAFREPQSLEHLFRVACGLDSLAIGETEILGQLKKAYDLALRNHVTGACLNKAFQRAFNVAKHVRTQTGIQRGNISIASVAVELAEKVFSELSNRTVLVIGAGDTSEKTARALASRGAQRIWVTNRSLERAKVLAQSLGGQVLAWEDWAAAFEGIDVIISSTSAPGYVLDRTRLQPLLATRGSRPLLIVDIAVPRDVEPEVNFLENVYLYNVDDLQSIASGYLKQRQEEIARCESIIWDKVKALLGQVSRNACLKSTLCPE